MRFLVTRPRHDNVTHYLFYWAEELINEARQKGLEIIDLTQKKAKRKTVESYLSKQAPELVIFNGHGNDVCVTGHDNEELISADKNEYLLAGKRVYMRACSAGMILGPKIMEKGAAGFIGYKKSFAFWTDADKFRKPLEDELARPFFEASNRVGISLIRGQTTKEAHEHSIRTYRKIITEMLTSESPNTFLLPALINNMRHQVYY